MENYQCGGYYFSSNFDSGNLAKVELVKLFEDIISPSDNFVSAEFNVWTKPDCGGTEYENLNRSWFLFSINGGEPMKTCKINVVNLNKQAKLFSQGMRPVIRIGETGKWDRTKENPTYFVDNENFTLSFLHKPKKHIDVNHYYAFTFPFTYTECQNQLYKYDKSYQKSDGEINYIMQRMVDLSEKKNKDSDKGADKCVPIDTNEKDVDLLLYTTDYAVGQHINNNCEEQPRNEFRRLDKFSKNDLENDIYYHRELLIHSVEGRNIDLITITSFNGIQAQREDKLINLFPNSQTLRSNVFKGKKIIFISSRVHPGETPASFVLNGFLKLILDKKSTIASTLRKMYVFKIVPFLNPDGVYNGCYRSDTLGHNLNRVYLNPNLDTQPSIYAVRKLIRYYHYDKEVHDDNTDNIQLDTMAESNIENDPMYSVLTINDLIENQQTSPDPLQYLKENIHIASSTESSRSQSSESEVSDSIKIKSNTPSKCEINKRIQDNDRNIGKVFHEKFVTEIKPIIVTNHQSPVYKKPFDIKKPESAKSSIGRFSEYRASSCEPKKKDQNSVIKSNTAKNVVSRKEFGINRSSSNVISQFRMTKRKEACTPNSFNINPDFTQTCDSDEQNVIEKSNMFLYIDLHGHASKKGVFMYGNHLPNTTEAVECMLLPRLMSMNSHHFHFDACVFSERNMYHKGKRDGLSKEGSGRVAIYKTIGLIKSYTLEGNYNTGKYINVLPPKGKEIALKKINQPAPKYTPTIFEEVGRALGPSILDLTNSNPFSRIQNSEFKTLQGLRNFLKSEIDRTFSRPVPNIKAASAKTKRIKNIAPCCSSMLTEVSKENKVGKNTLNKHITIFGKKEGPSGRKKGKVLCDVVTSITKFQEQQVPVPTKRPKVSKKLIVPLDESTLQSDYVDEEFVEELPKKTTTEDKINENIDDMVDIDSSIDLSIYYTTDGILTEPKEVKAKHLQIPDIVDCDTDRPCSSQTLSRCASATGSFSKNKKIGNFASMSSVSGNISSMNGKKQPPLKIRSKYSNNASLLKPLKRSILNKDSLKLKKKKKLKSEANLKRKKARVF